MGSGNESTKSMLTELFDELEKPEADGGATYEDRLVFERLERLRELRAASDFRSRPDETHQERQGGVFTEDLTDACQRGIHPGPGDAWPLDPFLHALRRTTAGASRDRVAFRVMSSLAADFVREDDAMPFEVRNFVHDVLILERQMPTMKGRPRKDYHRDTVFRAMIEDLCILTEMARLTGPENIGPERTLPGLLPPAPVNSPRRITLEYNGKIRP